MTAEDNIKALKQSDLFSSLNHDELESIAQHTVRKKFADKEVFIEQSREPDVAYLILSGSVKVFRVAESGNEITLSVLGPGEIVGEMSLLESAGRSASVQAIQESQVLAITKTAFKEFIKHSPTAAVKLLQTMAKRVRAADEHVEEIMTKNLKERVLHSLTILKDYFASGEITLSHESLAEIIGATRPRVTEVLDELAIEGKISLSHRKIKVS